MKTIGWALLAVALLLGASWAVTGNEFFLYKVFAPRTEAVRRTVFEQSKAYNQGVAQELDNEYAQYVKADSAGKAALAPIVLHQVADYDESKLPDHLRSWVSALRDKEVR